MNDPHAKVLLLVVDNPAHRVMLTRYLGKTPHHLVYSSDGEDGYDRFAEVKPDLVIAHLNVARLDGTILCQLLRQQPRGDSVPILLIGDESEDERIKKRIQAVGADGFLPVPFSGKVLLDAITPLLAEGRNPKLQQVILDPPTAPLQMGMDLKLAPVGGLDFPERTDGTGTNGGLDASIMESGDLPVPAMPAEHVDVDTVVSFQNPFYEGLPPVSTVKSEPATVAVEDLLASTDSILPDPSGGMVAPVLETEDVPRPSIGVSPVPRMESAVLTEATPSEPIGRLGILDEQLISSTGEPMIRDADKKDLSTKSRMLVEPQIGGGTSGSNVSKEPIKESSSKSRLIQELPRDERTPTGEAVAKGAAAGAAVRRGLDESQLGKRLAKRVRTMHRLLDEVDYYQLLGLEPGASLAQLKASYFDLSLEFHPDRFFLLRSGDLKEKIYAIYRRIAEAYRVLADEALRRDYDKFRQARISGLEPIEPKLPPPPIPEVRLVLATPEDVRARDLALIAEIAFVEGDLDRARLFLHLARHYEPKKAPIDAALAKVVARLGPTL